MHDDDPKRTLNSLAPMAEPRLKRALGNSFAIAVLVGGIIGLGILRTPGEIASLVSDPVLYLSFWLAGGVFVLMTLAVLGELIGMAPRSGGCFILVSRAYGPYGGFLIGWVDWVSFPAILALKGVVIVEFAALLIPALSDYTISGAIVVTSFFAMIQLLGIVAGSGIQRAASAGIGLIAVTTSAALFYGGTTTAALPPPEITDAIAGTGGLAFVVAAIIFTYDGWLYGTYFSGELKGGGRAAAIAALKGLGIVTGLYLIMNAALVYAVPLEHIRGQELAFATALDLLFGERMGSFIIVGALFTLLSQQNLAYMSGSRVLYALSVDGLGSRRATSVSERGTPVGALLPTWGVTVILILMGGFNFLLNLSVLLYILVYIALTIGVYLMRKHQPDTPRPYRAFLYPWLGTFTLVGWIAFAVLIAVEDPMSALNTLAIVAFSLPAYHLLKRFTASHTGGIDNGLPQ